MVRAKFKVTKIELTGGARNAQGQPVTLHTVTLVPVYSTDPSSENRKFWSATPSGEIRLGTINPAAGAAFVVDGEYYVDFTPASAE